MAADYDAPTFQPFVAPTPLQQAFGWLVWLVFFALKEIMPWRWLQRPGFRGWFALWIYSRAWYWAERADGRV